MLTDDEVEIVFDEVQIDPLVSGSKSKIRTSAKKQKRHEDRM